MGCGALSANQQVLKPQLQFLKTKSLHKNQQTQIWTCQNRNRQKFSIKVFKKIFITDENQSMLRNFQQEVNRLHGLSFVAKNNSTDKHLQTEKHLMPYLKAWKDQNGNLSLIMKYIDQKSLGQQVKGRLPGLFDQVSIAKLTEQIIRTIKYLRENGSIFCNFKPSNVFLQKGKQTIIMTDYYNLQQYFKLSENNIFRNAIYSAPQNVLFNQYFKQSDIWRVGCFIVQMLTCIKPWYKQTTENQKIIQKLKSHSRPPIPCKISSSCKGFLQKCFQTDHNRRASLQQLLCHQFIRTSHYPQKNEELNYQRENTQSQEIVSYNLQVQLIEDSPLPRKINVQQKELQPKNTIIEGPSPIFDSKKVDMTRRNITSDYVPCKKYDINRIIPQNDQNYQITKTQLKKTKKLRSKRIKTQAVQTNNDFSPKSPNLKQKSNRQILTLFNKAVSISNPYESPKRNNNMSVSRKVSKTANYRLSTSKRRIPTNQITLNNEVVQYTGNSSTKYWPAAQIGTAFDYIQTAQKLNVIMKQIQEKGGQKYYRKPLKLLKQRLKEKSSLRTQASITMDDSRALYNQQLTTDIQQIQFDDQEQHITTNNQYETENSNVSRIRQNWAIQTMASKAQRSRYQMQKKTLMQQRQKEKKKWEKELVEGRQFIKNQINSRYRFNRDNIKALPNRYQQ